MTSAVAYISCFIRPNLQNNIQTQRPENQWTLPEAIHKAGEKRRGGKWCREGKKKNVFSAGSKPPRYNNQRLVDNLCLHCVRLLPTVCLTRETRLLLCCLYLALCRLTVWLQEHESPESADCKLIINTVRRIEIWCFILVIFILCVWCCKLAAGRFSLQPFTCLREWA